MEGSLKQPSIISGRTLHQPGCDLYIRTPVFLRIFRCEIMN